MTSTGTNRRSRAWMAAGMILTILPAASRADDGPRKVTTVEGITEYALGNGLQVLLFPDPSTPTFTVNITYRVGSRHEGRGEAGMAHLLEHMVFKGTPTFENIWGALEDHGARFNGTTWVDRTNYFETLPATDENLDFALRMEADRMINSTIAGEELAKEMTVVRNEFEMGENDPIGILSERMASAAFLWHNYGKSTIGNRSDIERVPVENLRRFYRRYYQPDNATLVVAGKFDADRTLDLIQKYFGSIPRPDRVLDKTYTQEPAQDGPKLVTLRRVGDVAAAGLVYHVPAGPHPDFPAVQVLEGVLTTRPSGRLYKALVESELAASVSGSAFAWAEPGIMQFMAEVRKDRDPRQALDEMQRVVETVATADITDEEVERIKTQMLKNIKLAMTNSGRIGVGLSEAIAQGDWRLFFIHRDRIESVTTDDVKRVAAAYLQESNRTAGLFIPTPEPSRSPVPSTPDIEQMVSGYRGGEAVAAGEAFEATTKNIEGRTERKVLPSGIKVALLRKGTRGNAVNARLSFRYGSEQALAGHRAAIDMIPSMLMRGTRNKDYQALRDAIDAIESRISVGGFRGGGGGLGDISVSIESDKENIVEAIELVAEIMKEPAFSPEEFETVMTERLARREQGLSDPRTLGMIAMRRTLTPWPKDSIHYVPTLEESISELRSVSLGSVTELYNRLYGAGNLSVAVVGSFDEDKVVDAIERQFGDWKSTAGYERIAHPHIPYDGEQVAIVTPDKEMATVGMAAAFPMRDDHPDYPALSFASYILGQSAKSRLMNRLRHEGGLSYGAGARLSADENDERATVMATAICAPQNAAKALDAMREEITRWVGEGVTDEELEEGKNSFALRFDSSLANDRFVLGQLVDGLENDRTLEFEQRLQEKVQGLSRDDISAALARHLGSVNWVEIKAGDLNRKEGDDATSEDEDPGSAAELPDRLKRLDTNGDGKIQKSEAPERMEAFFGRLDANGDGAIDGEEAAGARAGMGEGRGGPPSGRRGEGRGGDGRGGEGRGERRRPD